MCLVSMELTNLLELGRRDERGEKGQTERRWCYCIDPELANKRVKDLVVKDSSLGRGVYSSLEMYSQS